MEVKLGMMVWSIGFNMQCVYVPCVSQVVRITTEAERAGHGYECVTRGYGKHSVSSLGHFRDCFPTKVAVEAEIARQGLMTTRVKAVSK